VQVKEEETMRTVTASEFQKNFGAFKEIAQREAVSVTSNGRESVVLLSAAEYAEYLEFKKSRYAYDGKVTEGFKGDVAHRMEKHRSTLENLAK